MISAVALSSFILPMAHLPPAEEVHIVEEAQQEISAQTPFLYLAGSGPEKTDFTKHSFLTLNVCMFKGRLPQLYGGITAPVADRAKQFANFIAPSNPDILILQEVPQASGQILHEQLKTLYPHFWTGIGSEPDVKEAGLFVASKYPLISEPKFYRFSDEMQRNYEYPDDVAAEYGERILHRGFFALETEKYWIVTSHLEPGSPEVANGYRRDQLKYTKEQMDILSILTGKPYIVAGDLNIERTGQENDEYSQSGIPDLFYDHYTKLHPQFDASTYTCTNILTARVNNKEIPKEDEYEIDDYVLIPKGQEHRFDRLNVTLQKTYNVDQELEANLTDHHAYSVEFETP